MNGLRSIVPLSRDSMRGVIVRPIEGERPTVEWANPRDLYVEESYQRSISESGTSLIRRIAGAFSWHKLKPPVCFRAAEHGGVLVVVDGQHTAIAAATRKVELIPIIVISKASLVDRAEAFVGHNKDRLSLTMMAIFHAELAAGDKLAREMKEACDAAGAKILPYSINVSIPHPPGTTVAIGTIRSLLRKHGAEWLTRVMKVLVAAGRGPVKAQEITAASIVLAAVGHDEGSDGRLAKLIASKPAKQWAAIASSEEGHLGQAIATVWMRELDVRARPQPERIVVSQPAPNPTPPPAAAGAAAKAERVHVKASVPPSGGASLEKPGLILRKTEAPPVINYEPTPAPRKVGVTFLAQANGITVTIDGAVSRVGRPRPAELGRQGAALVSRLLSVMPAQIGHDRLADKIFDGRANRRQLLDDLVASVNPDLRRLGLEIFEVKTSGYMLREMANIGENRLLA